MAILGETVSAKNMIRMKVRTQKLQAQKVQTQHEVIFKRSCAARRTPSNRPVEICAAGFRKRDPIVESRRAATEVEITEYGLTRQEAIDIESILIGGAVG